MPPPGRRETLDEQVESASPPPGAKIKIYASATLYFADLDSALDSIITGPATEPRDATSSESDCGLGEPSGTDEIKGSSQKIHCDWRRPGVNVLVASGDAGSNPDVIRDTVRAGPPGRILKLDINVKCRRRHHPQTWLATAASTARRRGRQRRRTRGHGFKRQPWQQGLAPPSGTSVWCETSASQRIRIPEPDA